jgi:magnesium chelatase subunit H
MPKHISAGNTLHCVIVTLDHHLAGTVARVRQTLAREYPGMTLSLHAVSDWSTKPEALAECKDAIAKANVIVANMLFIEEHVQAILPALQARREDCKAMAVFMSAGEAIKMTSLGRFQMGGPQSGFMTLLKKLKGSRAESGSSGERQMKMLRRLPKILRFIPGTAQDVRAYFVAMQYWLAGSEENIANMIRYLGTRYVPDLGEASKVPAPREYPEVGLYHPAMAEPITSDARSLPAAKANGTIGVLLLRSYVLSRDTGHYDGVIRALEARGLRVIPAFATGLDSRPAVEAYFLRNGVATVDAVVSLSGFSLVGGPAYNDSKAAEAMLAKLDVPYLAAHPLEFQTLEEWGASDRGLQPVESTIMVAIPELEGATGPIVFGGRSNGAQVACTGCERGCVFPPSKSREMHVCEDRADMLAARIAKLVALRRSERAARKVGLVIFNFPPNAGNTGTAAYLAVFESLFNTLNALRAGGYTVEVPASVEALRDSIIIGNKDQFGSLANVFHRIPADDHVRREKWLGAIEKQWGAAPGKQQADGRTIHVLGAQFGNVFVGVQPSFGYEGDPMRLLFEKGFAPTHAFSAFYRWLREDFGASAVLHFGTHGALEFMPGKQAGMSGSCWPDRLIGDLPNFYLYASNNPSEGMIAKRRGAATLVSYLTPPVAHAGLYRGLVDLKASIDRWRKLAPEDVREAEALAELIQAQATTLDFADATPVWPSGEHDMRISALATAILELEYTLIPHGLHVVGQTPVVQERVDLLMAVAEASHGVRPERAAIEALVAGQSATQAAELSGLAANQHTQAILQQLSATADKLGEEHELPGLLRALDGRYVHPAQGGDLLRTPEILPTGRNLHGFDPFRIPSAFAVMDGAKQAERLLARHRQDGNGLPETVAIVLWGTDNLKNEGGPIGQVLALLGARPRFDSFGRLTGASLIPLEEMNRPRIDCVTTLSGIFRDLLPLQIKLIAEAAFLAASADEPPERNFVRKHALAYQRLHNCDLETAALRVFCNADGAYGANVNNLVESSNWDDEDAIAETYTSRKSFAYGRSGRPSQQKTLLNSVLGDVELAYQNLDSVELGVTTVDNYFDTLGGISRAVHRARGGVAAPVYIGDQTSGQGAVRTLNEQVALETRTRTLNPKWFEGMLKHGYEGVRQIETHVTNTMGWSATTGQVSPWVYQKISETFVLDEAMRNRLAELNVTATAKVVNRLLEASRRDFWKPDAETLQALQQAGEELEDKLEGIGMENSQMEVAA